MGPSGRTRTRTRTARKARRKSELMKRTSNNQESGHDHEVVVINSPTKSSSSNDDDHLIPKTEGIEFEAVDDDDVVGCSTPKGQRFRIPEIRTCPPAPKKQRVISNCSIQRTPIAFFAPPDLELFFYFALRGISV
ncbi:hypothetical protein L484_015298 [Morus notabilis]|uniref:Cyclin-dependent protein kinase inhibitor SMR13 n=1 Tax=Morus notabilis TaxID=981085 RepID=W9RHW5_9ROSA|nr:cyclin-dependent protein kinase inhibitor SMR9 [Morus notabilis]EXB93310.1 hypothetical protein L484_015298 [Morus notabilis]